MVKLNHFKIFHYDGGIFKQTLNINRRRCTKIEIIAQYRNGSFHKERINARALVYDGADREIGSGKGSFTISPFSTFTHTIYFTRNSEVLRNLTHGKNTVALYVNGIMMKKIHFFIR